MRKNYPLLSEELNDMFQDLYFKLTYILGYDDDEGVQTYKGQFDIIEEDLREAIYLVLFQMNNSKDQLVVAKDTAYESAVYSTFGRCIIIKELRSM